MAEKGSKWSSKAARNASGAPALPTFTQTRNPGDVAAVDFQFDSTIAGKSPRILSNVDERTTHGLAGKVK